jgi:hypothetical protein
MNERSRQERLRRKRMKREERRTARSQRRAMIAPVHLAQELLSQPKMSDTLVAFAKPLIDELPDDIQAGQLEFLFLLAMGAWNAVLLSQQGGEGSLEEELRTLSLKLAEHTEAPPPVMLSMLRILAERKQRLFADDPRVVVTVHVAGEAPHFRILATSSLPGR